MYATVNYHLFAPLGKYIQSEPRWFSSLLAFFRQFIWLMLESSPGILYHTNMIQIGNAELKKTSPAARMVTA